MHSLPGYGSLTRQSLDDLDPSDDADPRAKRDPRDFALWKGAKAERARDGVVAGAVGARAAGLAPGVLGDGRRATWAPSSTSTAAGIDLRFPHHENELAQSRAAGDGFARYWLHNGLGRSPAARR